MNACSRSGFYVAGRWLGSAVLAGAVALGCRPESESAGTGGRAAPLRIERLDPRLDALIPRDAALDVVVDGRDWTEGPVWDPAAGALLFSDVPRNVILRWKAGEGAREFLPHSGHTGSTRFEGAEPGSNGLAFDRDGHLVICQHGDRRVARRERDGRLTTLADRYEGKRLNSPNDLVFAATGDLHFTDPAFGLLGGLADPGKELDFQGVYRLSSDGALTLITRELDAPNGIGLSADGRTLYVSNASTRRPVWMAYELRDDGGVGPGRLFADATPWLGIGAGLPDGLKVDRVGNLFATGPGGIHIFAPDGTRLGRIETGSATGNLNWGDDGTVLYIAADDRILRLRTSTSGSRGLADR